MALTGDLIESRCWTMYKELISDHASAVRSSTELQSAEIEIDFRDQIQHLNDAIMRSSPFEIALNIMIKVCDKLHTDKLLAAELMALSQISQAKTLSSSTAELFGFFDPLIGYKTARCKMKLLFQAVELDIKSVTSTLSEFQKFMSLTETLPVTLSAVSISQLQLEIVSAAAEAIELLSSNGLSSRTLETCCFFMNKTNQCTLLCCDKYLLLKIFFYHTACRILIDAVEFDKALKVLNSAIDCVNKICLEVEMDSVAQSLASKRISLAVDENAKLSLILSLKRVACNSSQIQSLVTSTLPGRINSRDRLIVLYQCFPSIISSSDSTQALVSACAVEMQAAIKNNSLEWSWDDLYLFCRIASFASIMGLAIELVTCVELMAHIISSLSNDSLQSGSATPPQQQILPALAELRQICDHTMLITSMPCKAALCEVAVVSSWLSIRQLHSAQELTNFLDVNLAFCSDYYDCLFNISKGIEGFRIHCGMADVNPTSQILSFARQIITQIISPTISIVLSSSSMMKEKSQELCQRLDPICKLGCECIFVLISQEAESDVAPIMTMTQGMLLLFNLLQKQHEAMSLLTSSLKFLENYIRTLKRSNYNRSSSLTEATLMRLDMLSMRNKLFFRIADLNDTAKSASLGTGIGSMCQEEARVLLMKQAKGDIISEYCVDIDWVAHCVAKSHQRNEAPNGKLTEILEKIMEAARKRKLKQRATLGNNLFEKEVVGMNRVLLKISDLAGLLHDKSLKITAASMVAEKYCVWTDSDEVTIQSCNLMETIVQRLLCPRLLLKSASSLVFLNVSLVSSSPRSDAMCWIRCNWIVTESATGTGRNATENVLIKIHLACMAVQASYLINDDTMTVHSLWLFNSYVSQFMDIEDSQKNLAQTDIVLIIEILNARPDLCEIEPVYAIRLRLWSLLEEICTKDDLARLWKYCFGNNRIKSPTNAVRSSTALKMTILGCSLINKGCSAGDCSNFFGRSENYATAAVEECASMTHIISDRHCQLFLKFYDEMKRSFGEAHVKVLKGLQGQFDANYDTNMLASPIKELFWMQCLVVVSDYSLEQSLGTTFSRWKDEAPMKLQSLHPRTVKFLSRSIISISGELHHYAHFNDSAVFKALQCVSSSNFESFDQVNDDDQSDWMFDQLFFIAQVERNMAQFQISHNADDQVMTSLLSLACCSWIFLSCGKIVESINTLYSSWNVVLSIHEDSVMNHANVIFSLLLMIRVCIDLHSSKISQSDGLDVDQDVFLDICHVCMKQMNRSKLHESVVALGREVLNCIADNQGHVFTEIMLQSQQQICACDDESVIHAQSTLQEFVDKEKQSKALSQKKRIKISRVEPTLAESESQRTLVTLSDTVTNYKEKATASKYSLDSIVVLNDTCQSLADKSTLDLMSVYDRVGESQGSGAAEEKSSTSSNVSSDFKKLLLALKKNGSSTCYGASSIQKICGDIHGSIGKLSKAVEFWNDALDCLLLMKESIRNFTAQIDISLDKKSSILCLAVLERLYRATPADIPDFHHKICHLASFIVSKFLALKPKELSFYQREKIGSLTGLFSSSIACSPRCISEFLLNCAIHFFALDEFSCMIPLAIMAENIATEEIQDSIIEQQAIHYRVLACLSMSDTKSLSLLSQEIIGKFRLSGMKDAQEQNSMCNWIMTVIDGVNTELTSIGQNAEALLTCTVVIHFLARALMDICNDVSVEPKTLINVQNRAAAVNMALISKIHSSIFASSNDCQCLMTLLFTSLTAGLLIGPATGNIVALLNCCNGWLLYMAEGSSFSPLQCQMALKIRYMQCSLLQDTRQWKNLLIQTKIGIIESKSMNCPIWEVMFRKCEVNVHFQVGDISNALLKGSALLEQAENSSLPFNIYGLLMWRLAGIYYSIGMSGLDEDEIYRIRIASCLYRRAMVAFSSHLLEQGWIGASECALSASTQRLFLSHTPTYGQSMNRKSIFERRSDSNLFLYNPLMDKKQVAGSNCAGMHDKVYLNAFMSCSLQFLQMALNCALIKKKPACEELKTTNEDSCWQSQEPVRALPVASIKPNENETDNPSSCSVKRGISSIDRQMVLNLGLVEMVEASEISETLIRLVDSTVPIREYVRNMIFSVCGKVRSLMFETSASVGDARASFDAANVIVRLFERIIESESKNGRGDLDLIQDTVLTCVSFIALLQDSALFSGEDYHGTKEFKIWLLEIGRRCQAKQFNLLSDCLISQKSTVKVGKSEQKKDAPPKLETITRIPQEDKFKNIWQCHKLSIVNRANDWESFFWNGLAADAFSALQESASWMADVYQLTLNRNSPIPLDYLNVQWVKSVRSKSMLDVFIATSVSMVDFPAEMQKPNSPSLIMLKKVESINADEVNAVRASLIELCAPDSLQLANFTKLLQSFFSLLFRSNCTNFQERESSVVVKVGAQGSVGLDVEVPMSVEFIKSLIWMVTNGPCEDVTPSKKLIQIVAMMIYS